MVRAIAFGFLAASLATAAAVLPDTAIAADAIRAGFSLPRSGVYAPAAASQENAYTLWREQVNARGGLDVGGTKRPVEFVIYDDQSDPAKVVQMYEKLIVEDKVDLLFAPWGTANHFALAGLLERHKFPMMGNSASSTKIGDLKTNYIWLPSGQPEGYADALPELMKAQGVKKVAILSLQFPFSLEMKEMLAPKLKAAGIDVVVSRDYPNTIRDMTAQLSAVQAAKPDAILSFSYPADSTLYMNQAREIGLNMPFQFVLIGPSIPFFRKTFGPSAEGIMTMATWSPHQAKWPRAKVFYDAYKARFNDEPDYTTSAIVYISCEIVEQAIATAGLDREKLRAAYSSKTFDTISGPIAFKGPRSNLPPFISQIQDGQIHLIWPKEFATASYRPKPAWLKK